MCEVRMPDDVKPRRRRWRVTLYNPLAHRRVNGSTLSTCAFTAQAAEAASMGRAFTRALKAGGEDFLAQPPREGLPAQSGYDFCGAAVHAFEMARAAMVERSGPAYRVAVTVRGFTVEIERVR